jgi:hypothetical protein
LEKSNACKDCKYENFNSPVCASCAPRQEKPRILNGSNWTKKPKDYRILDLLSPYARTLCCPECSYSSFTMRFISYSPDMINEFNLLLTCRMCEKQLTLITHSDSPITFEEVN